MASLVTSARDDSLPKSASFVVPRVGEDVGTAMAMEWCARAHFFNIWQGQSEPSFFSHKSTSNRILRILLGRS